MAIALSAIIAAAIIMQTLTVAITLKVMIICIAVVILLKVIFMVIIAMMHMSVIVLMHLEAAFRPYVGSCINQVWQIHAPRPASEPMEDSLRDLSDFGSLRFHKPQVEVGLASDLRLAKEVFQVLV